MAVLDKVVESNQGLIKELDKDSLSMIMDVVQKDIYSFPIESSIRENFSNAYDSIKEKKIALSILNRETTVGEHYVEDERLETKASIFDEAYYDVKYLDPNKNKVLIKYSEAAENGKDIISFRDYGVGLGADRLVGYMKPGYSSKRLSMEMLGKYGLGSKSALSTEIEYYVLDTWYNGHHTKFMIYDDYYKCITNPQNAAKTTTIKGYKEVDGEIVEASESVYWEDTDESNGVCVSFEVKSHDKEMFIEAVKKQLMYFGDHLDFHVVSPDGYASQPDFKADILYETDLFIVSRNNYFSVPHILINNVVYGIVDYARMGMNKKFGSIAIKGNSSDVDVNASREMVKWTKKTQSFIHLASEDASKEAGKILEGKLTSIENPVERYLAANRYSTKGGDDEGELLKQLRNFGGAVTMHVTMKAEDYLTKEQLQEMGYKKAPRAANVKDVLDMLYLFNPRFISIHGRSSISVSEIRSVSDLNFKSVYYSHQEDKVQSMRSSMALYIKERVALKDTFQFLSSKEYVEKPMPLKEFALTTQKLSINKDGLEDALKDKKVLNDYRIYLAGSKRKSLYFALFRALVIKHGSDIRYIDTEDIKAFAKDVRLSDDPALKLNSENRAEGKAQTVYISTKSETDSKREILAQLKKEKKIVSYRNLSVRKAISAGEEGLTERSLVYDSYSEQVYFRLLEIETATLDSIRGTVVYGTTASRSLLLSAAYMSLLASSDNRSYSHLTAEDEGDNTVSFIQVAKDNVKFFKQIPGAMSVEKYIKESHSVDDGKLSIHFGEVASKFVTGIYLHKTLALDKVNFALDSAKYVDRLKTLIGEEDVPNIIKAASMLKRFPVPVKVQSNPDAIEDIKNNFKRVFRESADNTGELIDQLYKLSHIQNLPVEGLADDQQAVVKKFDEIDVKVFDKEFIDGLDVELLKYREVMELTLILHILADSSSNYDKTRMIAILEGQISEKLLSL